MAGSADDKLATAPADHRVTQTQESGGREVSRPSSVTVRLEIPVPTLDIVTLPSLVFDGWLPETAEQGVEVRNGDISLKVWCDRSCVQYLEPGQPLSYFANLIAEKLLAEIKITSLAPDFVEHVIRTGKSKERIEGSLDDEYCRLGQRVYELTVTTINRLLAHVRTVKGQYWLLEYAVDIPNQLKAFETFKAKVSVDGVDWVRWWPSRCTYGESRLPPKQRYLKEEDWKAVEAHVCSTKRVPLVLDLLAAAEAFAGQGHRRVALTEAVSALETATAMFVSRSSIGAIPQLTAMLRRLDVDAPAKLFEKVGLRATVGLLLPLLLAEEVLSAECIRDCQEAVEQRNNGVHNGQRDVDADALARYLRSIRHLCELLHGHVTREAAE